jgi:ABC-2 type transport system permease protein
MDGLSPAPDALVQLACVIRVRSQIFINSLRRTHNFVEFAAGLLITFLLCLAGIVGALGLGSAAWFFQSQGKAEWLTVLLWPIFLFWQIFSLVATAFTEVPDFSDLLRFPLSYPSYLLVLLLYGSLDAATLIGSLWLLGITVGIGFASPGLLPWVVAILLAFGTINILLARMIYAWLECWLARRRTRELLGIVFFAMIISFQFIGPLISRLGGRSGYSVMRVVQRLWPAQRVLPPGLSANAIAMMAHGRFSTSLGLMALLCTYGIGVFYVLNLRLRSQYRGENLSEVAEHTVLLNKTEDLQRGWVVPGLPGPSATVFEKEVRYLCRSGPTLLTLIMPIFMLLVLRLGPLQSGTNNLLGLTPAIAFPLGAAYALLVLTNLVYNNFGADSTGIQLFFTAPVTFRKVVLAKNLAHVVVLCFQTVLVWLAVAFMYQRPSTDLTFATLAVMLFAAPVNLALGNVLSICGPKKVEFGKLGRQRASHTNALIGIGIQMSIFVVGTLVLLFSRHFGSFWPAASVFLALAIPAFAGYAVILNRIERIAHVNMEILISELCHA